MEIGKGCQKIRQQPRGQEMNITKARELLIKFNEWRRVGDGDQIDPTEVGLAIDCAIECMADAKPSLEWTMMQDEEPAGEHGHVECWIILKKYPQNVEEYPWNTHHKCFDDKDYDDFAYSADDVLCWIEKPSYDFPEVPSES